MNIFLACATINSVPRETKENGVMPVTVYLPDEILSTDGEDISRKILEQIALDGFRSGQITTAQVRRILGFESRLQVYEFLASHGVPWVDYDEEELRRELETLRELTPE
jgi:predicted HTH domain antitoxin